MMFVTFDASLSSLSSFRYADLKVPSPLGRSLDILHYLMVLYIYHQPHNMKASTIYFETIYLRECILLCKQRSIQLHKHSVLGN